MQANSYSIESYRQQAKYLKIGSHKLAYWEQGSGPVILLIHGFPSASWDWHKIWPALQSRYRLVAFDLLGFGLSDKPYPYEYQLSEQAELVNHSMKALEIEQAHVLAHDYGDSVAQQLLLLQHDGQLDFDMLSICFLNGGLFAESHRPLLTQKLLKGPFGSWIARFIGKSALQRGFNKIFAAKSPPTKEEIECLWSLLNTNDGRRVMPAILDYIRQRKVYRDQWTNAMQASRIPLRFINGEDDPISGRHMLERYQQLIDNADTCILGCGHYPQLELPNEVIQHYSDFVTKVSQEN